MAPSQEPCYFVDDLPTYDDEYSEEQDSDDGVGAAGASCDSEDVCFTYESMELDGGTGIATFVFSFCRSQRFTARTLLPRPWPPPGREPSRVVADVRCALFHVGLTILPWYWMGFACRRVIVAAGYLTADQASHWEEFYRGVLAEFFFLNGLGPDHHISLEVAAPSGLNDIPLNSLGDNDEDKQEHGNRKEVLCCMGGGKDSLVAFELLRRFGRDPLWLHVGEGFEEYEQKWRLRGIVAASGVPVLCAAHELADGDAAWHRARLRTLRMEGYPWVGLVATTAVAVAVAWGVQVIAAGNERSAAAGNGVTALGGLEVNHQYDKSAACDASLRDYFRRHIASALDYFSPLQPMWELQIARVFCGLRSTRAYIPFFLSCNSPPQMDWCGSCAKCCFIYALLAAWLSPRDAAAIFSREHSDDEDPIAVGATSGGSATAARSRATHNHRRGGREARGGRGPDRKKANGASVTSGGRPGCRRQPGHGGRAGVGEPPFPGDLFERPELAPMFASLLGIHADGAGHKPFDCVGTEDEAAVALGLALRRRRRESRCLPSVLATLERNLPSALIAGGDDDDGAAVTETRRLLADWDDSTWLPQWLPPGGHGWFLDERGRDLLFDDPEL